MQHTTLPVALWQHMLWLVLMSCTLDDFVWGSRESCSRWPWCCLYAYPTSSCCGLWRPGTCWSLLRLDDGCLERSQHWWFCAFRPPVSPHTSQDETPSSTPSPIAQRMPRAAVESYCPRRHCVGRIISSHLRTSQPLTWRHRANH